MEVIHEIPSASSFTSLSEHQSRTPSTFYSTTPVLYHHSPDTELTILEYEDLSSSPLAKLLDAPATNPPTPTATTNGDRPHDHDIPEEIVVQSVDVWVTSERFILYRPSLSTGVSIPYPTISLHAIQSHASSADFSGRLYLQLDTSDGFDDHDPSATIGLTVTPSPPAPSSSADATPLTAPEPPEPPVRTLYAALSACANLHPDPASPGSEGGMGGMEGVERLGAYDAGAAGVDGLPPPLPGSGGWITAENVGDFLDAEGNWRGGELGAGAGVVRERERGEGQGEEEGEGEAEGEGRGVEGEEEAKRRRVE